LFLYICNFNYQFNQKNLKVISHFNSSIHQTVEMGLLSSSILEMLLDHMVSKGLLTFLSMFTNYCKKKSSVAECFFQIVHYLIVWYPCFHFPAFFIGLFWMLNKYVTKKFLSNKIINFKLSPIFIPTCPCRNSIGNYFYVVFMLVILYF
jgi:hypothetical protein